MDTSLFLRAVIVHFQVSESHLSDRKILILSVKRTVKRILSHLFSISSRFLRPREFQIYEKKITHISSVITYNMF